MKKQEKMSRVKKVINGFEFDVWFKKPDEIFHFPRSYNERWMLMRHQFFKRLEKYWQTLPKAQANLEREYFKELFNLIENQNIR